MKIDILGRVVRGQGYGRKLGFPTANLDRRSYSRRKLKIKLGVWAGNVQILPPRRKRPSPPNIGGELKGWYKGGVVIGPLDDKGLPKIEAHLLGFRGNLYGKKINLELVKYIRPFKKFKSEKALKSQIRKDIFLIKKLIPMPNYQFPIRK